jgi:nucleoside-diphosphate-sugar epimerase
MNLMRHKSVLITGATGFVGKYVVSELLSEGATVYALTRDLSRDSCCVPGVRLLQGDVTAPLTVPADVTAIFHCAGVITDEARMRAVNVTGTKCVVDTALSHGCRLVHLSSAGVIGPTRQCHIDELTPCRPESIYEHTKLEAEMVVLAGVASGLQATMLRPTTVIGIGRTPERDSFLHLLRSIERGKYRNIGGGLGIYGIVHAREVARAMIALERSESQQGDAYFINSTLNFKDFSRIAAKTIGCEESRSVPYILAVAATALLTVVSKATRKKMPLTWSRLMALTNPTVYSQERLLTSTDYRPLFSIEDYIAQVCAEYAAQGLL